jgi:hypothetical protein
MQMIERFAGFRLVLLFVVLSLFTWQTAVNARDDRGTNGRGGSGNRGGASRSGGNSRSGSSRSGTSSAGSRGHSEHVHELTYKNDMASSSARTAASNMCARPDGGGRAGLPSGHAGASVSRPGPRLVGALSTGSRGAGGYSLGVDLRLEVASLEEIEQAARAAACDEALSKELRSISNAVIAEWSCILGVSKDLGMGCVEFPGKVVDVARAYDAAARACRTGIYSGSSTFDLTHQGGPTSQDSGRTGSSSFDSGRSERPSAGDSGGLGAARCSSFDSMGQANPLP